MWLDDGKVARLGRTSHFWGLECEKLQRSQNVREEGVLRLSRLTPSFVTVAQKREVTSPKRQSKMMASLARTPQVPDSWSEVRLELEKMSTGAGKVSWNTGTCLGLIPEVE